MNSNCSTCDQCDDIDQYVSDFFNMSTSVDILVMTVTISVTAVLGVIGNSIVISVCAIRQTRLQTTQHYIFIIAVCDLIICTVLIPFKIASYHTTVPETLCKIFEGCLHYFEAFSLGLLLAIALDRYIAVNHPVYFSQMRYFPVIGTSLTAVVMLSVAVPGGLIAGDYIQLVNQTSCYTGVCDSDGLDYRYFTPNGRLAYDIYLIVFYCLAFTALVCMYSKVFYTVYKKFKIKTSTNNTTENDNNSQMIDHRQILRVCITVTLCYVAAWSPLILIRAGIIHNVVSLRMAFFLSSMFNPIIYAFSSEKFRKQASDILKWKKIMHTTIS